MTFHQHETETDQIEHELLLEDRAARRRAARLAAHPDCRDPDHPGCIWCEPDEADE